MPIHYLVYALPYKGLIEPYNVGLLDHLEKQEISATFEKSCRSVDCCNLLENFEGANH